MPGEKKQFIVQIPGEEHVAYWDEAKFNANQDKLYGKYPDAQVTEVNTQSINTPEDVDENGMYAIAVPGEEHVAQWDGKRLAKNREALLKKYPGAQVARINRYDYGAGIDNRSYRVQAQIDEVDRDISRGQKSNGLTEKRAALEQQLADLKGMGDAYQTALRDRFDEAVKSGEVQYSSPQWEGLQNGETEEQHRKRTEDELAALQSNAPAQHDWAKEAAGLNLSGEAFVDEMARRRKQAAEEQKEYEERLLKAQFEHDSNPLVQLDKRIDDGKADVQRLGDILRAKRDSYQAPAYVPPGAIMNTRDAALMSDKDYVRTQVAYTNALDRLHKDEMIRDHTVNSFWANAGNAVANPESWTFGLGKLYETGVVMDAVKDQGSESAKEALEQTYLSQMTDAEYQEKQGNKGRWGQMTGDMAQFVILNALGGSLFKGAGEAVAKKIAGESAEGAATSIGRKFLGKRIAGAAAKEATMAFLTENTVGAANTIAEMLQRHNGELVQNEDGNYEFKDGENWWKSIWNTEAEQFTEYFTERVGEHFGTISKLAAKTKPGQRLGLQKVLGFIDKEPVSGFERGVRNFFSLAGVQHYPGEVLEEEIGIVMSNMLQWRNPLENLSGALEGITDKQQQADIFGGMAFSIGLMQSVPLTAHLGVQGYNKIHGARLNDNLNRADQNAHRTFDSEAVWGAMKNRIDEAANEDMTPIIYEIANDDSLKDEEKQAALSYVDGTLRLRGFSTGVMSELQQATMTRRDAEAKDLLNTYGKFWTEDEVDFGADRKRTEGLEGTSLVMTDENGKAKTEKGTTRKIQYARRLTFSEDAGTGFTEGFVLSEDEGKVMVKANDGKAYFVDKEALAQMTQDGKAKDSGRVPLFMVLDQRATDMKDLREQQRMQQEARQNAGNLMNAAVPGTQINIGTEGAENVATVQGYENGQFVIVDSAGQQQTMSPKDMAGHLGLPFDPKTDEQINEINGRADEKTRLFRNYQGRVFNYNGEKHVLDDASFTADQNGNLQVSLTVDGGSTINMSEQEADDVLSQIDGDKANEYNDKIKPGATIHVSMEGMDADYVFNRAVVEDGDVIFKATDTLSGEEVDLTPEMVTNLDELMRGTEIQRDVNGNPVPETPATTIEGTQATDFFDDPVANALGISQDYVHVTPSGNRVVNRAKLWEDNPELWARWYDQQVDKTMSTRDYLENKLKKADEDVAAAVNDYAAEDQGEQNPDRLEVLRARMNEKMARQQQIKTLFAKYEAAQQTAAREAENAQRERENAAAATTEQPAVNADALHDIHNRIVANNGDLRTAARELPEEFHRALSEANQTRGTEEGSSRYIPRLMDIAKKYRGNAAANAVIALSEEPARPSVQEEKPKTANEIVFSAQAALGRAKDGGAKAGVLQKMFDDLGTQKTMVTTSEAILADMRDRGASEKSIREVASALQEAAATNQRVEGFFDPSTGTIYMLADQIGSAEDANRVQIHEDKHMENDQTGAPSEALRTGVTREEMAGAMRRRKKTRFYDNKPSITLADEILAVSAEIAEEEGVDAIPQRLRELGITNEEFINFVQNNIDYGRRNGQRRHLERRTPLQHETAQVSSGQDGRNREPEPAGVGRPGDRLDEGGRQGTRSGEEPAAEPAPAGESGAVEQPEVEGLPEEPAPQSAKEAAVTNEITANIGGRIEEEGGNAPTLFSITAGAEGAGLKASESDDKGNVVFVASDGRIFDGHNPITAEDLKNEPNTVMGFMMADALKYGTITPQQADTIWQKYADTLNRMLEKGLAENGGFDNLSSQWQWVGETVFKTIHDNSDAQYKHSIDITRVCKKNEAVIKAISALQRRLGYGITPGQIMDIYRSSIEEGYQVPCPVCYVFSRYIGNGYIATVAINGQKKYGDRLADPSTLTEQEKKAKIDEWVKLLEKIDANNKKNSKAISQAKKDIQNILDEIDGLSRKALNPSTPESERKQLLKQIKALDKRYKAALNVVSQSNLSKWIKNFAVGGLTKPEGSDHYDTSKAYLYDDTFQGFPAEYALDIRLTADAIRKYPGIQRMRKSLGSAGGKVIQFAANNDIGDVPMLLGHSESDKAPNYYKLAAEAKTQEERDELLKKASAQFKTAMIYAQQQSLRGGQRMWSWSDNIERLAPDVFFNLMQMEMLGGALQSYSKQLEGIKLVASMGGYVNGSLMGKGIGYQEVAEDRIEVVDGREILKDDITDTVTEYTGDGAVERTRVLAQAGSPVFNDNGKRVVLVFDDVVGIDPYGKNGKNGLFYLNATLDKAGNILVGMDDTHVRAAMADDRVFFIIPWHASGLSSHVLAQMMEYLGVNMGDMKPQDYTKVQEEKDPADGEVSPKLAAFWEAHRNETDFPCAFVNGIPSGKDGKLSQPQRDYRALRDAIFDGRVEGDQEMMDAVMRDEFLSQVYKKVQARVITKEMTAGDKKYVYPYEYWDESSTYETADVNGARYLEYCRRLGIQPKFVGLLREESANKKGKVKPDYGNFADDKGYWKLLIDRRMYGVNGEFQDLNPVSVDNYTPDLVDPEVTELEFDVTTVADDAGVERIADRTMALEENRPGGIAQVNYDTNLDKAVKDYESLSFSISGEENAAQLTEAQKKALAFVNGVPQDEVRYSINAQAEINRIGIDGLAKQISEDAGKLNISTRGLSQSEIELLYRKVAENSNGTMADLSERAEKIYDSDPIKIDKNVVSPQDLQERLRGKSYPIGDGLSVYFTRESIKKLNVPSVIETGAADAIVKLMENSQFAYSRPEYSGMEDGHKIRRNVIEYRNYVVKFDNGEGEYYCRFTIERFSDARLVSHGAGIKEVEIMEKSLQSYLTALAQHQPLESIEGNPDTKLLNFFVFARTGQQLLPGKEYEIPVKEETSAEEGSVLPSISGLTESLEKDGISVNDKAVLDEYGLSDLTMTKNGDVVTLNKIVAKENGKGAGTKFMNEFTAEADGKGWTMALTPDDTFGATSVSRLKKFYKRFGFKENKGKNTDFTINESMVRQPQKNLMFSITTYHGTGADFERFDHSHMSEGEGSQAYGWGTYVTTNKDTGLRYANAIGGEEGNRHLYTVEIPDDNGQNYIHWEKPLTAIQSRRIMNIIRREADKDAFGDEFEYELRSALGPGTYGRFVEGGMDYFLGNEYNYATDENPGAMRNAKLLSKAGFTGFEIPIDLMGRKEYEGSNYVIFDEDDLLITDNLRFSIRGIQGAENDGVAMQNLETAQEMEDAGKDAKAIWLATGWEKGADGKWREEIPDGTAKVIPMNKRSFKVKDLIDAPELFESYPEIADYKVSLKKTSGAGSFLPSKKEIELDSDYNVRTDVPEDKQDEAKKYFSENYANNLNRLTAFRRDVEKKFGERKLDDTGLRTMMHELQHAIQEIEGFAKGGSPEGQARVFLTAAYRMKPELATFAIKFSSRNSNARLLNFGRTRMLNHLNQNIDLLEDGEKKRRITELRDYITGLDDWGYRNFVNEASRIWKTSQEEGKKSYKNLAGEVESRNVEKRMRMTEEDRRNTPPSETEDVAREEQGVRFSVVTDPAKIEELENGEKELGYRTVTQNPDGSFGSPKASKLGRKGAKSVKTSSFELGQWEQAEENPQLATEDGKINLADLQGVDYNPYIHIRPDAINKQFTSAWRHPEQVYIQTSYPTSEMSSGYHAEKAKLPVGRHDWTNGDLILSRWDKPERVVPWEEVADAWEQEFKDTGVTFDIVSPNLLPILAERGVEILPPKKAAGKPAMDAYERWKKEQESPRFSISAEQDKEYMAAVNAGDMKKAQRMVRDAAAAAMPNTKVVDKDGSPLAVYHASGTKGITTFKKDKINPHETDASYNGFWFSSDENTLPAWVRKEELYRVYLNIENPILDRDTDKVEKEVKEKILDNYEEDLYPGARSMADAVRMELQHRGYDGVIHAYPAAIDEEELEKDGKTVFRLANGLRFIIRKGDDYKYEAYSYKYDSSDKSFHEEDFEGGFDSIEEIRQDPYLFGEQVWVAFEPSQIKSADPVTYDDEGNVIPLSERFNPENDDIRFSVSNHNQEVFVSNAERAVGNIRQEKATPEQWLKMIEKNGGLKAGEDKWLGLSQWLKDSDKKTLTKQEVLDFIEENKIKIEETRYAEDVNEDDEQALRSYQDEFDAIAAENGGDYGAAWDAMVDRYGEDFETAFDMSGDSLEPATDWNGDLDPAAQYFLDQRREVPAERINNTRLHYTTEGLDNKREIALTVPTIEPWNENDNIHFGDAGEGRAVAWIRFGDATRENEGTVEAKRAYQESAKELEDYREELVGKYALQATGTKRYYDLATPEELEKLKSLKDKESRLYQEMRDMQSKPKKVLFIDEIQSKRHQEGREQGYATPMSADEVKQREADYDAVADEMKAKYGSGVMGQAEYWDEVSAEDKARILEVRERYQETEKAKRGVRPAPFEKNWHELAMKRMLRLAAEEGYDYVAWTTGEQQADRYNLSRLIDEVEVKGLESGNATREVKLYNDGIANFDFGIDKDGNIVTGAHKGETLAGFVGKEMAAQIMDMKDGERKSTDHFKIGGEGMKGFYDEILPRFMNKYGKQWGVKVEDITLPGLENGNLTAHAVPVTQEMKDSVMEGQLMFSVAGQEQEERAKQIEEAEKFGLKGVIGEEGVADIYREAYASIPKSELEKIVDRGLAEGGNIYAQLRIYIHELAKRGTENDETGLLFKLFDDIRFMAANSALTDADIRWMLFKETSSANEGDLLALAEERAMRNRWGVGLLPAQQLFQDATEQAAEETVQRVEEAEQKLEEAKVATASESVFSDAENSLINELRTLTKAMAEQKAYDKATVDSVVKFAKEVVKNGRISAMTAREVSRLLSLVNNATGKSPKFIARYVNQLMDMLLDNIVKQEEDRFMKLANVKARKVNQSGVEAQGKLDIIGQAIIKAFRENMDSPVEDIRNRIEEVSDRLSDKDDAIREEAQAIYSGLMLALQYKENIAENIEEYKDLDKEFKDVSVKLVDLIGKKAYDEFIRSSEEALRKNRMERIDMYRDLSQQLTDIIKGGVERAAAFREAEKKRVEDIHHDANRDMQGTPAREHLRDSRWQRFLNSDFVRFFGKSLATADQMFRLLGRKSVTGEGYLFRRYIDGWQAASGNASRGIFEATEILDKKAAEVFDKPGMKWSDIYSIERKMKGMTVSFLDGDEMVDHELTQGNMLYIYMANKMQDGKMKLRRMGISEEDVEAIKKNLDPRFVELADWMQDEFYVNLRNKYNAVHERMFGAPMAAIEDYVPLKILSNARFQDVDLGNQTQSEMSSTVTGSIIKRRKNSLALDILHTDAFSLAIEHIEKMEDWAAFAELRRDMNALLSYKHFRNQIKNMNTVYGSGDTLWKNFSDVCSVLTGSYKPKVGKGDIDRIVLNVAKGVTGAKIAFRVNTAIKQLLSFPAYFSDARPDLLMKSIAKTILSVFRKGNVGSSWKWCMENLPLFEKRWKSRIAGDTRLLDTDSDWAIWKDNFVKNASRLGMTPNAAVDAFTVAIGAKAMYDTKKAQYLKDGYSEEKADEMAKRDAEILYNQTQQSSENAFVSPVQLDRTVMAVTLTTYRNSSMAYQRQLHDAIRSTARMMKPGYRARSIAFMKNQHMNNGLSEEQAQKAAERQYNRQLYRNLARVAIFGYGLQFLWKIGNDMWYLFFGDDDDEKKKILEDAAFAELAAPVEGLVAGNVISDAWGKRAERKNNNKYSIKSQTMFSSGGLAELPLESDMSRINQQLDYDKPRAINGIIDLLVQSGVGVNPQTFTDAVVAIIDYAKGDLDDATNIALGVMRIAQIPQSTIERFLIDQIDLDDPKNRKEETDEMAKQYAAYKVMKNALLTKWMYNEEDLKKRLKSQEKAFKDAVKRRVALKEAISGEDIPETPEDFYKDFEKEMASFQTDLNRAKNDNDTLTQQHLEAQPEYKQYVIWKNHQKGINKLKNSIEKTVDENLKKQWEQQRRDSIQTVMKELNENK